MSTTSIMMIYLSKPFFSQIETNSLSTLFNLILPNIGQTMRLFNWKIYRWNRYKLNNGKTNWVQFLVWWWTHQKHIIIWINNNSLTALFTVIVSKSFEQCSKSLEIIDRRNQYNMISNYKTETKYFEYNFFNDDVVVVNFALIYSENILLTSILDFTVR